MCTLSTFSIIVMGFMLGGFIRFELVDEHNGAEKVCVYLEDELDSDILLFFMKIP